MRRNVYTVGQVNAYIKNMFTQDFMMNRIYIKGEVSNCKYHTSGHIYFTLKDETGTMACVMFSSQRKGLAFRLEEGQKVIALGTVNVYERDGKYQLYAKEIVLDGTGDLYRRFHELKQQLEEMGMFSEEYKQPVPKYCQKIGVVTAPTGAAVQDIRNIAGRRNPFVQLILYPAQVQGQGAAESIVRGIRMLDACGMDVIIVGRGGGSIEDLWAFNEECVARAIFECNTPVISAVGHETDFTIADFVADLRAPTPSAAAELAVFEIEQIEQRMRDMHEWLVQKIRGCTDAAWERYEKARMRLGYLSPEHQLRQKQQYAAELEEKLRTAMAQRLQKSRHRLELYAGRLEGLSPLAKLSRGYAFVTDEGGKALVSVDQTKKGGLLALQIKDGEVLARVEEKKKTERVMEGGGEKAGKDAGGVF